MMNDEEFCFQVDAHSDFIPNWDETLMTMWGSVGNEYAVLSTAVPDVSVLIGSTLNSDSQQVPHVCQATFDSRLVFCVDI